MLTERLSSPSVKYHTLATATCSGGHHRRWLRNLPIFQFGGSPELSRLQNAIKLETYSATGDRARYGARSYFVRHGLLWVVLASVLAETSADHGGYPRVPPD